METESKADAIRSKSRYHDIFTVFLGFLAALLLATIKLHISEPAVDYPFYKGPLMFPMIALGIMTISSVPALVRLIRPAPDASWRLDNMGPPMKPAACLVLLILFFLLGPVTIGIEASVLFFLIISYYLQGYRQIKVLFLLPVLYTTMIVVLFKYILQIWFPEPAMMSILGG